MPENDPTLTWLCERCRYREVWRWAFGTVLCKVCTKQIASEPPKPLPYTPHPEGMARGRFTTLVNDRRTDAERMEAFRRWEKGVNRDPIKYPPLPYQDTPK